MERERKVTTMRIPGRNGSWREFHRSASELPSYEDLQDTEPLSGQFMVRCEVFLKLHFDTVLSCLSASSKLLLSLYI